MVGRPSSRPLPQPWSVRFSLSWAAATKRGPSAIVRFADSPARVRGADEARPSRYLQPYRAIKLSSRCRLMLCLVSMSAGLRVPSTFLYASLLVHLCSCTQRACTRRWRTLPVPVRWAMPSAALLSAFTSPSTSTPMSRRSPITPIASADAAAMACSSASADDRATVRCWRE